MLIVRIRITGQTTVPGPNSRFGEVGALGVGGVSVARPDGSEVPVREDTARIR